MREAAKRKGGHGIVKEVAWSRGRGRGQGGRQGRERKITDVGWSRDRKGGRKVKWRPRRSRKEEEFRTKKMSLVAGNPWGNGLNINARTYREVVSAVRLGRNKNIMQQCGNHMFDGQEWIHHHPLLLRHAHKIYIKETYRVSPKDCIKKPIQI